MNGNYRNKLNFTWEALDAAQTSLTRLYAAVAKHKAAAAGNIPSETIEEWKKEFTEAVSDDLNVPLGLGILWKVLKNSEKSHDIYEFALFADQVLGLSIEENSNGDSKEAESDEPEVSQEILELVEKRTAAKKAKDFKTADEIRDKLKEMGITLIDTKEGVKIVKE